MTDFAFPDISEADAPAQVPTVKPTAALDLEKLDLTALAVHKFGDWRGAVATARKTLDGAVHDLSTQAKVDEAKSLRFRLIGQPRADVRKVSKGLKSKLAAVSKAVGAEEDAAVAAYDEAEKLITPQIDAREAELEAARVERERIAAERIAKQAEGIARIRGYLIRAQTAADMTADRVALGIAGLESMEFTAADWLDPVAAADAQCQTVDAMRLLHGTLLAREAEAARLEAQRVENERVAREQAEQRAELDRQAEALKAQQQRIADIQARIAEIRAAATGHDKASATDLREAAVAVAALDVSEAQYAEFAALAQAERATTLAVLEKLRADAVHREDAAADSSAEAARAAELEKAVATLSALPSYKGGTPLLQDECKGLSVALATKPDAPMHAREAAEEIALREGPLVEDPITAGVYHVTLEVIPPMAGTVEADPFYPPKGFVDLVMSAFDCKFPSHPKPSIAWWAAVRKAGEELRGAA